MTLLNTIEAAERLRIAPITLRKWASKKKIEIIKIGGRTLYDADTLDAFIESGRVPAKRVK